MEDGKPGKEAHNRKEEEEVVEALGIQGIQETLCRILEKFTQHLYAR